MKRERRTRVYIIVALAIVVGATTVAYAALQTTLNISGYVNQKGGTWDIHFENVGNITTTGQAELRQSQIQTTGTDLYFAVDLVENGDSASFTVDVVNSGTRNARLVGGKIILTDDLNISTGYELVGEFVSNSDVIITATWQDGTSIIGDSTNGDLLNAGDKKTLKVTIVRTSSDKLDNDKYLGYKLQLNYQQK